MRNVIAFLTILAMVTLQIGLAQAGVCEKLQGVGVGDVAPSSHCSQKAQPASGCCGAEGCQSVCLIQDLGSPVAPPTDREVPGASAVKLQVVTTVTPSVVVEFPLLGWFRQQLKRPLNSADNEILLLKVSLLI